MTRTPSFSDDQMETILKGGRTGIPEADALSSDLASFRDALTTPPSGRAHWVHLAAMRRVADEERTLQQRRTRRFAASVAAVLASFGFLGVTGGLAAADSLPGPIQRGVETIAGHVGLELGGTRGSVPTKPDHPVTPRSSDDEPGSAADAPGEAGTSPGQAGTTPGQTGTTPGQAGTTPGQSGTTPGQTGTTPGQAGTTPGQTGTTPGQTGTTPGQAGTTPGQSAATPGQTGTTPGQTGTTPGQTGTTPGQSGTTPGQTGTTPGGSGHE